MTLKFCDSFSGVCYAGSMQDVFFKKSKSLDEVIKAFLYARKAERYSPHTVRSYESALRKFSELVDGSRVRFEDVDADHVRIFLGSMSHLSDKTVLNCHIVLSSLWTWAIENELVTEHVVRKVKKPRYLKKRVIPFTEDEVRRLMKACRSRRDRAVVMVLLDCGLRAAELCMLTVDDWTPGYLKIRQGKGKKSRVVPICKPTEDVLFRQLCKRRIGPGGISGGRSLFASNISGNAMNYNALRSVMRRLERLSSVANVHPHRFRHTFAISFLRNGGNIYTLKVILGHSTLEMVQNYLDIARSDVTEAHQKASPVLNWQIR